MRIKSRNKVQVSFSLSGMTDIVFLLLLFFMLTSTLVAPNALKLLIPQAGPAQESNQSVPEVELYRNGEIFVDGQNTAYEQLEPVLLKKLAGNQDPAITLITTPDVSVKETVKVMNVAAKNNIKVVLRKE